MTADEGIESGRDTDAMYKETIDLLNVVMGISKMDRVARVGNRCNGNRCLVIAYSALIELLQ